MKVNDFLEARNKHVVAQRSFQGNSGRTVKHDFKVEIIEDGVVRVYSNDIDDIISAEHILDRQDVVDWLRCLQPPFANQTNDESGLSKDLLKMKEQTETLTMLLQEIQQRIQQLEQNQEKCIIKQEARPYIAAYKTISLRNGEWDRILKYGA